MKSRLPKVRSSSWKILLAVGLIYAVLGLVLKGFQGSVDDYLENVKQEFEVDRDLAHRRDEHLQVYQQVLDRAAFPSANPISQTVFMQIIQEKSAAHKLSLKEMEPTSIREQKGSGLSLSVRAGMLEFLGFLYDIAKSENYVYVDRLTISPADDPNFVEVQMILTQMEGR